MNKPVEAALRQVEPWDKGDALVRPRTAGQAAPAPSTRPENTLAAEKAAGFGLRIGD